MPDAELFAYLASLDVAVLPYRFGTHSGWLEACRDLGTTVVAPSCGYYADQGPVVSYVNEEDRFDPDSFEQALAEAVGRPRSGPALRRGAPRATGRDRETSTPACTTTSSKPTAGSRSCVA